jgi:hypothetical protein
LRGTTPLPLTSVLATAVNASSTPWPARDTAHTHARTQSACWHVRDGDECGRAGLG